MRKINMKLVLSPAKSLNFDNQIPTTKTTKACFLEKSERLNKLLKKNHIVRCQSEEDKRVYFVDLSEEGKLFFDKMSPKHMEYIDSLIKVILTDEEKDLLASLLTKLGRGLEND